MDAALIIDELVADSFVCAAAKLPGIGPMKAAGIVAGLGPGTLDILSSPDAVSHLQRCQGIGKATAIKIKAAWDQNKGVQSMS